MTNYVNWMISAQATSQGIVLPTEGSPEINHEVPASGVQTAVAGAGVDYATVWATVAVTVSATNLKSPRKSGLTYALPANTLYQVTGITPGQTKITLTDI